MNDRNRSHNTLDIGNKLQDEACEPCPIAGTSEDEVSASTTFDLTHVYTDSAKSVTRTASFETSTGTARITDDIINPSGDVLWRALTRASCEIKGNQVTVNQTQWSKRYLRGNSQHPHKRQVQTIPAAQPDHFPHFRFFSFPLGVPQVQLLPTYQFRSANLS